MKLYVAGKLTDDTIPSVMGEATTRGYRITHDWTREIDHADRSRSAKRDIRGVQQADALLVLMTDPEYAYRGTFTEVGCALGLNKLVIIVNPNSDSYCVSNVFYCHPEILHVRTLDNAWQLLKVYCGNFLDNEREDEDTPFLLKERLRRIYLHSQSRCVDHLDTRPIPEDQVGGTHYQEMTPEPITVIEGWNMGHHLGNAVKYLARWDRKDGITDLRKAVWYIERKMQLQENLLDQ